MAKSFFKKRRNDFIFVFLAILLTVARFMPRKLGLVLFGWLGKVFYLIPTVDQSRTTRHLELIYSKQWTTDKIRYTAKKVYFNIGKNIFDSIYLAYCTNQKYYQIVKADGFSYIQDCYNEGKGLIAINSHLGCYEMTVRYLARQGMKCLTIGQQLYDPRVDKLISALRQQNQVKYLHRDKSGREILRFLKQGGALGTLLDQDTNLEGVFAYFLGLPAHTPTAPIRLAMRNNIPITVVYSGRQPDNTHFIQFCKPLKLHNTGDFTKDLVLNTQMINDILCKGIKLYPQQWIWMHQRWRKKPEDEQYKDIPNIQDYQDLP